MADNSNYATCNLDWTDRFTKAKAARVKHREDPVPPALSFTCVRAPLLFANTVSVTTVCDRT